MICPNMNLFTDSECCFDIAHFLEHHYTRLAKAMLCGDANIPVSDVWVLLSQLH